MIILMLSEEISIKIFRQFLSLGIKTKNILCGILWLHWVLTTKFLSEDKLTGEGLSSGLARSLRRHIQYSNSHLIHYEFITVMTHLK